MTFVLLASGLSELLAFEQTPDGVAFGEPLLEAEDVEDARAAFIYNWSQNDSEWLQQFGQLVDELPDDWRWG
jgi:hypothetical protein